ncbi:aldehyde dehydrogenase [Victivallis sp. Marseille-Q1083]|uniref:aldehyde dehydrogenase n=1 Tax=Victivallis sp. Marseille-Q1083 TaxID=2717288 RepID=UPI00158A61E5|nr:aldehyde dehydrogenase [Victivallis sp. Marseille-Q1083]
MEKISTIVAAQREFFASGRSRDLVYRRRTLKALQQTIRQNRARILHALASDLHKNDFEATLSEYLPILNCLKYTLRHLTRWARPKRVGLSSFNWPGKGRLLPEPYGTVLIGATWNYPFLLALEPLIGALAAGNTAIVKLSDQAPVTAHELERLLGECFEPGHVTVTVAPWDEVLAENYDYIFFTGGMTAGRLVLEKASRNLTPVTLELGGKSPCLVEPDADLKLAARRIVWGKFLNAGQTCVAPDYLLVHSSVKDELTRLLRRYVREFFGDNPQDSPDFSRIVNNSHYDRLCRLLGEGRLICGGEKEPDSLYIAPTIIDDIDWDNPLMAQEIFGPILPVLSYESLKEAVASINARPKPLTLYLFSRRRATRRFVASATSSGSLVVNDTVMQLVNPKLPFGGVGDSGMGAYHGKASFDTFSHIKSVMVKGAWFDWPLRYPPFTEWKSAILRLLAH